MNDSRGHRRRSISVRRALSLAGRGFRNSLLKKPLSISFEVTHACNARCRHCHLGGGVKENRASPGTYAEIARRLKPVIAQFSGGEPLIRQDLAEIIRAVRVPDRAPYIVVTTNAVLLTAKRYAELREAGVDEFSISLDYPDERHDEFRRVPGLFARVESLIGGLEAAERNHVTLCCVIQHDNYRDLVRMAELARQWKVGVNFSCYTPLRTHDLGYMIPPEELAEFREIYRRLLAFKKAHRIVFTSEYSFRLIEEFFERGYRPCCRTGERFCNVNPDGTFSPCGLIIKDYTSLRQLKTQFASTNTCVYCLTSLRVNSEQPLGRLAKNALESL